MNHALNTKFSSVKQSTLLALRYPACSVFKYVVFIFILFKTKYRLVSKPTEVNKTTTFYDKWITATALYRVWDVFILIFPLTNTVTVSDEEEL